MNSEKLLIPGAIVIAGLLVAGGIFLSGGSFNVANKAAPSPAAAGAAEAAPSADVVRPVDPETDHIFGNPDAKVTIVEYSDFECPFCARHHPTLEQIVEESEGEVNWVYRHFPLTQIHSRAQRASIASECVADLAGGDSFWTYSEVLLANMRSLGDELYIAEASKLGVAEADMVACLDSGKFDEKVNADLQNGIDAGGRGTPFNVVITAGGDTIPFSGALPIEQVRTIVEQAKNG